MQHTKSIAVLSAACEMKNKHSTPMFKITVACYNINLPSLEKLMLQKAKNVEKIAQRGRSPVIMLLNQNQIDFQFLAHDSCGGANPYENPIFDFRAKSRCFVRVGEKVYRAGF
jgi:hypothetical protein